MLVGSLYEMLDERFPFGAAASWDPVGLQLGSSNAELGSVAVCHEVTDEVADYCVEHNVSTLVSYHPLLFDAVTAVTDGTTAASTALRLLNASISLIVVHTAMDVASGGTADQLAHALSVTVEGSFYEADPESDSWIGRYGTLDEHVPLSTLAAQVSKTLGSPAKAANATDGVVTTVAVIPGSGSDSIPEAGEVADVLVTGDISHHSAREALRMGLSVIDAGHIPTERPGVNHLYDAVRTVVPGAEFVKIDPHPWEDVSWNS